MLAVLVPSFRCLEKLGKGPYLALLIPFLFDLFCVSCLPLTTACTHDFKLQQHG